MSYLSNSGRERAFRCPGQLVTRPEEARRLLGKTGEE